MKAIIWKELREIGRWAALGFLALLLAEAYALRNQGPPTSYSSGGITLCGPMFLMVSAFGCAALGAALGALQILPERRRDQWASLLHRPVSRGVILGGKMAAGAGLLLAATGLPLLACIGYVAMPGHFPAPFVWGLDLPPASDLLLGLVFYLAALLLGLEQGRWWGRRGVLALGVAGVFLAQLSGVGFLWLPLVAAVALGLAAWGAIMGDHRARPWVTRLALGLVLLAGMETVLLLASAVTRWSSPVTYEGGGEGSLEIASDGSVFIGKQRDSVTELYDLEGKRITDERYASNEGRDYFLYALPLADRETPPARDFLMSDPRSARTYLQMVEGDFGQGVEYWYLLPPPHHYFVGYDKLSGRQIGICDGEGFKPKDAVPKPFAATLDRISFTGAPHLFWAGPQCYAITFGSRTFTPFFRAAEGEHILGSTTFPSRSEAGLRIATATDRRIYFHTVEGTPLQQIPLGHLDKPWEMLEITATSDFARIFLQYQPPYRAAGNGEGRTVLLDVLDEKAALLRAVQGPTSHARPAPRRLLAEAGRLLAPPLPALMARAGKDAIPPRLRFYFQTPLFSLPNDFSGREWLGLGAIGVICAGVAVWWARRGTLSRGAVALWAASALLFGIAGLLAFRLAVAWSPRLGCPVCGKRRSVVSEACPHCAAAWPAPAPTGAEIFEPA